MGNCLTHTPAQAPGCISAATRRVARARRAGGTVLIVTMWILIVLAGLVLVLARAMRAEGDRAANSMAAVQATAVQEGAIQYVLSCVDGLQGQTPTDADTPCEAIRVGDGTFWILRPGDDERTCSFGITDEGGKLNLNTATLDMLSRLPGMTSEFAASIIDWRDPDSNITAGGAESEYYLMLPEPPAGRSPAAGEGPYECSNAPLETVEELFLVRDATTDILYGRDANRNGIIDAGENDRVFTVSSGAGGSRLDRGILGFVTIYGGEPAATASATTGAAPAVTINVNDAPPPVLIVFLRNYVSSDRLPGVFSRTLSGRPFRNVLDFYYRAGLTIDEFKKMANRVTTSRTKPPGLINVNTAPREVLLCLPGLDDGDASALISARTGANTDRTNIAWVAEALSREKAIAIGGYITAVSYFFSADIVSVGPTGRAFKRCRVVIDARSSPPKVIYRQNLTHLGWPLASDIIARLRAGQPLETVSQTISGGIGQP